MVERKLKSGAFSLYLPEALVRQVDNCEDFGEDRSRAYKVREILNWYFNAEVEDETEE